MKACLRCHEVRPHAEFGKSSRSADGLCPYCKPCERKRRADYVAANRAHVKALDQRSIEKNRLAINRRKRERRAANPEATKAQRKLDYAKYREKELATMRAWKASNRAHMHQYQKERYWADPEASRAKRNAYNDANRGLARAHRMARIARQKQAHPTWADNAAIKMLYDVAARVGRCMGIPHEVDHIVPLRGAKAMVHVVSGLHVEYNLRVVAMPVNRSKSNIQWPDMPA